MNVTNEDAKEKAMKKLVLSLTAALMLGFGATTVAAAEPAMGPSGFPAASERKQQRQDG